MDLNETALSRQRMAMQTSKLGDGRNDPRKYLIGING
jgi:hypothetical protein